MEKKDWLIVAAVVFFLVGFYYAYLQDFKMMWIFFVTMAVCFGLGMKGRNTWIQ
jgi:Sec-independent protein secretion pathway component TatC